MVAEASSRTFLKIFFPVFVTDTTHPHFTIRLIVATIDLIAPCCVWIMAQDV